MASMSDLYIFKVAELIADGLLVLSYVRNTVYIMGGAKIELEYNGHYAIQ